MRITTQRSRLAVAGLVAVVALPGAMVATASGVAATTAGSSTSVTGPVARSFVQGHSITLTAAATPQGSSAVSNPEFATTGQGGGPSTHAATNHAAAVRTALPATASAPTKVGAPTVSFDGLNHYQQRTANNGNQFSLEPPDQGLCASAGFEVEALNDVLRVYDPAGNPLTGVTDLNTFYGYPAAVRRDLNPRVYGQFVTDPSCYFDPDTQHWYVAVLTLDRNPNTGAYLGSNHIDLAVSQTADPTKSWTDWSLAVQDDGTAGTPKHHCTLSGPATGDGPCFGDYPHIGFDATGFYLTTNEYSFFGPEFHGAQLYTFPKAAFVPANQTVKGWNWDTAHLGPAGQPGFTMWPATSPVGQAETANGGTEYLLSSNAASETGNTTGVSSDLITWALTGTAAQATTAPTLTRSVLTVGQYNIPPKSKQKAGHTPQADCLNDANQPAPGGLGCWRYLVLSGGPFNETEGNLDSNDTRMQQVTFAHGHIWGALDTGLLVNGVGQAGIEWFEVTPSFKSGAVKGTIANQGYLGKAGTDLDYPAIGVTASGKGVMAFTLTGAKNFPSAAYATLSDTTGVGAVQIAKAGVGPQDGFCEYVAQDCGNTSPATSRPRWGDYGATAVVDGTVWIASEYIGQTCTLTQWLTNTAASPFGTCNRTRTALANWDTRISAVTP